MRHTLSKFLLLACLYPIAALAEVERIFDLSQFGNSSSSHILVTGIAGGYSVILEMADGRSQRFHGFSLWGTDTYIPFQSEERLGSILKLRIDNAAHKQSAVIHAITPNTTDEETALRLLSEFARDREFSELQLSELENVLSRGIPTHFKRDLIVAGTVAAQKVSDWNSFDRILSMLPDSLAAEIIREQQLISKYILMGLFNEALKTASNLKALLSNQAGAAYLYARYDNIATESLALMLSRPTPSNLEQAGRIIIETLARAEPLGEPALTANLLDVLWLQQNFQSKQVLAEHTARRILDIRTGLSDERNLYNAYNSLAISLADQGRFAEAISARRKSLAHARVHTTENELAIILSNTAGNYRNMGNFEQAIYYYNQALEIAEKNDFKEEIEFSRMKLASIERTRGNPALALAVHRRNIDAFKVINPYFALVAQLEAANDSLALGDLKSARNFATMTLTDETVRRAQVLDARLLLLEVEIESDNQEAVVVLEDQLMTAFSGNFFYPLKQLRALNLLISRYASMENLSQAAEYSNRAKAILSFIQSQAEKAYYTDEWSQLATGTIESIINIELAIDKDLTRVEGIYTFLEEYYSVRGSASQAGGETDLQTVDQLWDKAMNLQYQAISHRSNNEKVGSLLLEANAALDDYLAYEHKAASTKNELAPVISWEQTLQKLSDNEAYLRYFIGTESSFGIFISKNRQFLFDLPAEPALRKLVSELSADIRSRRTITSSVINELMVLLPPVNWSQIGKLVITPDSILHQVPFSALVINSDPDWGRNIAVVRSHSASDYLNKKPKRIEINSIAIFADPEFNKEQKPDLLADASPAFRNWLNELPPLPHTAREAEYIQREFPHVPAISLRKSDATSSALLSEAVRSSSLLHIATHGYFDERTPSVVGIATSPDLQSPETNTGFLSLAEFLRYRFSSQLVVISGCETMLGKHYLGRGMNSLTRGFLNNGAENAIGTLWKVSDRASADFMRYFYSGLAESQGDVSAALLYARTQQRKSRRDPYHWAGFVHTTSSGFTQAQ